MFQVLYNKGKILIRVNNTKITTPDTDKTIVAQRILAILHVCQLL